MRVFREGLAVARTRLVLDGLRLVAERLAELGWCRLSGKDPAGQVTISWARATGPFFQACGWGNQGPADETSVLRFLLLLELLAQEVPPATASDLVRDGAADQWALIFASEIGRGRCRPSWWDREPSWHEDLRAGIVTVPLLFPWAVEEGLVRTLQRLAEFGWTDMEAYARPGGVSVLAGSWHDDVVPLVTLLCARPLGEGSPAQCRNPALRAAGRLSLMLHLKLLHAPASLVSRVVGGGDEADLWAAVLAVRVVGAQPPLWWGRKPSWHVAVRQRLGDEARAAGLMS